MITKFFNCQILRNGEIISEDLWVRGDKIIDPSGLFYDEKVLPTVEVDMKGATIIPGLIDLQINGAFGIDFSLDENLGEGLKSVAKKLLSHGVTSFCPTIVSSSKDIYYRVSQQISLHKFEGGAEGARVLGFHYEGPFISTLKKGAHVHEHLRNLEGGMASLLDTYCDLSLVKIVTLAPELDKDLSVVKGLTEKGIVVSLGHSAATTNTGEEAIKNGAKMITHLYNAMHPFHHRDPGIIGLIAGDQEIYFGLIADSIHMHSTALRIAERTRPKGAVLVTDAMAAMGLKDGSYTIGNQPVTVKGLKATITGTDTLCGSVAPLLTCVKNYMSGTNCSLPEAVEAATLHPAQVLKLDSEIGTLNFGSNADFVALNEKLEVIETYIRGERVYSSN